MKRLLPVLLALLVTAACAQQPAVEEDIPLYSQAELDQMLAPIALYPDELLSQLLMAATYPLEIVQAARWSRSHPELTGQDAVRAAEDQPWDPSVKAMLAFPRILSQMDEDLEWTRGLGDAFLAQQEQVMDTVQGLRARAEEAGNLRSNEQVEVVREYQTIVVRNVYPDIAYLPYYDPYEVYGTWWWPTYRPVRWNMWSDYRPYYGYQGFYWGPAVVVGHGFFFSRCDWRYRRLNVVDVPPFYYRRSPPRDHVWEHDRDHRRGVPYRHQRVYDRYADPNDPVPRREPRERRERVERGTVPVAAEQPLATPVGQQEPAASPGGRAAAPQDRVRRRDEAGADEPSVPRAERRARPATDAPALPVTPATQEQQQAAQPTAPAGVPRREPRTTTESRQPRAPESYQSESRQPRTPESRVPRAAEPATRQVEESPRYAPSVEPRQPREEPRAPRAEPREPRPVPPPRPVPAYEPPASSYNAPAPGMRSAPPRQSAPRSERAPREARESRPARQSQDADDDSRR